MTKTYYDAITDQINAGLWQDCMAMFDRAWTLDFYYRLYSLVLKYEPERRYGYQVRITYNDSIASELGASYHSIEPHTIKKAVQIMESLCVL